jgi:hypothetical protein
MTYTLVVDDPVVGQNRVYLTPASGKTFKFGWTVYQINQLTPTVDSFNAGSGLTDNYNYSRPLVSGNYRHIVNAYYTDGTTEELRFDEAISNNPAPDPSGYPTATLNFYPDYYNRWFSAQVVLPSPYLAKDGSVGYIIQQTNPFVRFSRVVPVNATFSGQLPNFPGTFYFQVDGAVNSDPVSVFQLRYDFTITLADLVKPRMDTTFDNANGTFESTLTETPGFAFALGSTRWALNQKTPVVWDEIFVLNGALGYAGLMLAPGDYEWHVTGSYQTGETFDAVFPFTMPDSPFKATINFVPDFNNNTYNANVVPGSGYAIKPGSVRIGFFDEFDNLMTSLVNNNGTWLGSLMTGASGVSFYFLVDGIYQTAGQEHFYARHDFTMP